MFSAVTQREEARPRQDGEAVERGIPRESFKRWRTKDFETRFFVRFENLFSAYISAISLRSKIQRVRVVVEISNSKLRGTLRFEVSAPRVQRDRRKKLDHERIKKIGSTFDFS